jgi:hypothetical protein
LPPDWVNGYIRSNGTHVASYFRTHANSNPYDNLSYHGYPSQQPGYISPRTYSYGTAVTMPRLDFGSSFRSSLPISDTCIHTLPSVATFHTGWDSSLVE